jgi:hypothetical protein
VETKNPENLNSLWIAIKNFDIDGSPADLPFAKRLAKEHGWSQGYANRVIEEYRRFVFLGMAAGHPVSPSRIVDEAWHLHLLYTDSYWNRLTKEVLPRPLHHNPSKGGKAEDKKHADWYSKTLVSYRTLFGHEPPLDIWPVKATSSSLDTSNSWTISKRPFKRWVYGGTALASILGLGVGCTPFLAQTSGSTSTFILVITGIAVLIVGGLIAFFMMTNGSSNVDPTAPNQDMRDSRNTGATYSSCGGSGDEGTHSHGGHSGGPSDGDSGGGDGGGCGGGGGCSS